jgi:hypothetical protein
MKTQHAATIQFSGYTLGTIESKQNKNVELTVVKKLSPDLQTPLQNNSMANDPKNWDIDWFNSYE